MLRIIRVLLLLIVSVSVHAAVTISPASPAATDVIRAQVSVSGLCSYTPSTTVTGNLVRTDMLITSCIAGPPNFFVNRLVTFGPLPPGTYTYEVYEGSISSPTRVRLYQLTFTVAAPPVPLNSGPLLAAIAAMLTIAALIRLKT